MAGRAAKHAFGLKANKAASLRAKGMNMMAATVGVVGSPLDEKTRLSNKVRGECCWNAHPIARQQRLTPISVTLRPPGVRALHGAATGGRHPGRVHLYVSFSSLPSSDMGDSRSGGGKHARHSAFTPTPFHPPSTRTHADPIPFPPHTNTPLRPGIGGSGQDLRCKTRTINKKIKRADDL